jgi:hypothetical protein
VVTWTNDELVTIGNAEEMDIAPLNRDGSLRKSVTIWVVRVGSDLYIRSYKGYDGAWFRGTQVRQEGRVWAGGLEKDVNFMKEADPGINEQIDAAYSTKYRRYPQYVAPMLTPEARATTLKLLPSEAGTST